MDAERGYADTKCAASGPGAFGDQTILGFMRTHSGVLNDVLQENERLLEFVHMMSDSKEKAKPKSKSKPALASSRRPNGSKRAAPKSEAPSAKRRKGALGNSVKVSSGKSSAWTAAFVRSITEPRAIPPRASSSTSSVAPTAFMGPGMGVMEAMREAMDSKSATDAERDSVDWKMARDMEDAEDAEMFQEWDAEDDAEHAFSDYGYCQVNSETKHQPVRPVGQSSSSSSSSPSVTLCVVCLDRKPDHIFLPCMHVCVCPGCATSYRRRRSASSNPRASVCAKCPVCQERAKDVRKVFV